MEIGTRQGSVSCTFGSGAPGDDVFGKHGDFDPLIPDTSITRGQGTGLPSQRREVASV